MTTEIKNPNETGNIVFLDSDQTTVLKTLEPGQSVFMVDAGDAPPPDDPPDDPPSGTLADAVAAFNAAHASDQVICGGLDPYTTGTALGGGSSGGDTYIDLALTRAVRRHGAINAVRFSFSVAGPVRIQTWRPDSSGNRVLVAETATFTPSGTDEQLFVLPSPLTCLPGDVLGIWMAGSCTLRCKPESTAEVGWIAGHPTTVALTSLTPYNRSLGLTVYSAPPFMAIVGDSIQAGHGAPFYRPFLDGGPSGDPTGEPASYIREEVPAFVEQNFSKGSQTWAWAASVAAQMAAVNPKAALAHFGPNDIAASRSWTDISADMATWKAAFATGTKLFVVEVLPWNCTDAQAVATRDLNANYATWCAANGATLIPAHDAMGQNRSSTSHLDDLKAAYDSGDGIHPGATGKAELGGVLTLDVLDSFTW